MAEDTDRINAAALLLARGTPLQPALVCDGRTVGYGELRKSVARAATLWQDRGLAPGEVVMLRGELGVEHVVAFLGAVWAGAVPVPLRARPDAIRSEDGREPVRFALDRSRAGGVNGHGGGAPAWNEWQHELAAVPPITAVACEPWAPACWTEPRNWSEDSARVLPHRFALGLMARPGLLDLAQVRTMLGVLRALRRGVTVMLPGTPARHRAEFA